MAGGTPIGRNSHRSDPVIRCTRIRVIHCTRMRVVQHKTHSAGRARLPSTKQQQQPTSRGCLIGLVIALLILIGAIANACSGSSTPVSQPLDTGSTSASPSPLTTTPTTKPSPIATRRHHRHHHHYYTSAPPTAIPPPPVGCHPLSNEGTCYQPGEFCRDSDHGATGVAGDGETIICEDNDGWRWEPA